MTWMLKSASVGFVAGALAVSSAIPAAQAQEGLSKMLDAPLETHSDDIQRFCSNIADAARERRYAIQKAELDTLRGEIEKKMAVLEKKRAELEDWVKRRDEFSRAANDDLVEVYAKMRPDAAAARMEKLPGDLTAALLTKLDPRAAGTILNEMDTEKAAMVTVIMAAAGNQEVTN